MEKAIQVRFIPRSKTIIISFGNSTSFELKLVTTLRNTLIVFKLHIFKEIINLVLFEKV